VSISARGVRLIETVAPTSEAIYAAITRRYGARKLRELQAMLHELEGAAMRVSEGDGGIGEFE
jgi:hypothetical protein